jgi:hypothetical protein
LPVIFVCKLKERHRTKVRAHSLSSLSLLAQATEVIE